MNLKKTLLGLSLLTLCACNNQDDTMNIAENPQKTITIPNAAKNPQLDVPYAVINNTTYYALKDGFYIEEESNTIATTFKLSNLNYIIAEQGKNFIITNKSHPTEKMTLLNIRENKDGSLVVDIEITSEKIFLKDVFITLNQPLSNSTSTKSWGPIIKTALELLLPPIIKMIQSDKVKPGQPNADLLACQKAMSSTKCPTGKSPYMNFDAGSWYQGSKCSIGCK